jgi:hypothetical protein
MVRKPLADRPAGQPLYTRYGPRVKFVMKKRQVDMARHYWKHLTAQSRNGEKSSLQPHESHQRRNMPYGMKQLVM